MQIISKSPAVDAAHCEAGSAVLVDIVGRVASEEGMDNLDGPIFQETKDCWVVVGDKDVTPALELGFRFMKEGEEGLIYSHSKYGYGPLTRTNGDFELSPDSNIVYEVNLKRVVGDFPDAAFEIEIAQHKKQNGNDKYQNEWSNGHGMHKALHLYRKGADLMSNLLVKLQKNDDATGDDAPPDDDDDDNDKRELYQQQAFSLLLDCLNNTSAVLLKAKEYGKAKLAATEVLAKDPNNMKALLRAARAALLDPAGTFEESDAALQAAQDVDPNHKDLKQLWADYHRRKRDYEKKSKAMYAKMMMQSDDSKKKKATTNETMTEASLVKEDSINPQPTTDDKVDESLPMDARGVDVAETVPTWTFKDYVWKYRYYILQLIMPFITYFVFTLMRDRVPPPSKDEVPQVEYSNTEF